MSKILITGASGFIGGHLKKQLSQIHEVTTPTHQELDLTDERKTFLASNDFDWIIHCASVGGSRLKNDQDCTDNILMIQNILKFRKNAKFLTFGSGAEFDFGLENKYGFSKRYIRNMCQKEKNCFIVRIFGCFGIGEPLTRFPTTCIKNARTNRDIVVHKHQLYDFMHVMDICKLVKLYINHEIFFPSLDACYSNTKISLYDLANYIRDISYSSSKIILENCDSVAPYVGLCNYNIAHQFGSDADLKLRIKLFVKELYE